MHIIQIATVSYAKEIKHQTKSHIFSDISFAARSLFPFIGLTLIVAETLPTILLLCTAAVGLSWTVLDGSVLGQVSEGRLNKTSAHKLQSVGSVSSVDSSDFLLIVHYLIVNETDYNILLFDPPKIEG